MIFISKRAASLHIHSVILWTNGMVTTFNDQGQQMPEFQGPFEKVATRINAVFSGNWEYGDWNRGIICDVPLPQIEAVTTRKIDMKEDNNA